MSSFTKIFQFDIFKKIVRFAVAFFLLLIFQVAPKDLWAMPIEPTFEGIYNAITSYESLNKDRTMTIEGVLALLPKEYLNSFALMYDSRSMQQASPEAPRVLLFGKNARSILTFNALENSSGYQSLEMASVNSINNQIEFRSIDFPKNGFGKVQFSEANPSKCAACHGIKAHYIWGQYANWPGAYGSRDDALELTMDEVKNFENFKAIASDHPRYKFLKFGTNGLASHYRPKNKTIAAELSRSDFSLSIEYRPNMRLGMLMVRHMARAALSRMELNPNFYNGLYGLGFFLTQCDKTLKTEISDKVFNKLGAKNLVEFAQIFHEVPRVDWSFALISSTNNPNYYSGLWLFSGLLQSYLWENHLGSEIKYAAFYNPARILPALEASHLTFYETETGQEFWETIDHEGKSLSGFPFFEETDLYLDVLGQYKPSSPDLIKICTNLYQDIMLY